MNTHIHRRQHTGKQGRLPGGRWGGRIPVGDINAFKSPEQTFKCSQILLAGWVIDCVWSNGIKRQWWPWAGHSGGDGSGALEDGEKI